MMNLAPIALFAYNRPEHLRKTLESLQINEYAESSELFIFSDGPKPNASEKDIKKIEEVRKIIREKNWCGKVNIIEAENNKGLADSIIDGVTKVVNEYGKVIVLEDDLVSSPYFLDYMNKALEKYENEERVMQISGYMFPVEFTKPLSDAMFLPFTTTWGWATWKRAWKYFDETMNGYEKLKNNKQLRYKFDMEGTYPYFKLLEQQKRGKVSSWGIVWYLSVFMNNGLTLHPIQTLVSQTGFGKSATHTLEDKLGTSDTILNLKPIINFPNNKIIEQNSFEDYINYFRSFELNSKFRILKIIFNPYKLKNILKNKLGRQS